MIDIRSASLLPLLLCLTCVVQAPPPAPPPPPVSSEPTAPSAAGELGPEGAACTSAADCQSGICEGQGCGPDRPGVCASSERMCTMDLVAYCGCDGQTFYGSSGCPKQRYADRGECADSGADGTPSATLPDGAACDSGAECASGVCEGQGCGPKEGVCAAKNRACTKDLVEYCGCDGQTFRSSGNCPGQRFASRGSCEQASATKKPAGSSCDEASECDSGICEGQGCGPGQGVCAAKQRMCTRDLRAYCGCDGQTFRASGTCPNRRFSGRGECP